MVSTEILGKVISLCIVLATEVSLLINYGTFSREILSRDNLVDFYYFLALTISIAGISIVLRATRPGFTLIFYYLKLIDVEYFEIIPTRSWELSC